MFKINLFLNTQTSYIYIYNTSKNHKNGSNSLIDND